MPHDPHSQDPESKPAAADAPGRGEEDRSDADCRVELRDLSPYQVGGGVRRYYEF